MSIFFKKYFTIFFTIYQVGVFILATKTDNNFLSSILLVYFYYATFTGWHECLHRDFSETRFTINKFIGVLNMVPLLILNYKSKIKQHLDHHKFTNDPLKDPDYKTNNLIFEKGINNIDGFKFNNSSLDLIEIFFKVIFVLIVFKYWFLNGSFFQFISCYIIGNIFTHIIVNLLPHYKTKKQYGRDFKSNFLVNLLLFGNNLHGKHHKYPSKAWWETI